MESKSPSRHGNHRSNGRSTHENRFRDSWLVPTNTKLGYRNHETAAPSLETPTGQLSQRTTRQNRTRKRIPQTETSTGRSLYKYRRSSDAKNQQQYSKGTSRGTQKTKTTRPARRNTQSGWRYHPPADEGV